MSALDYFNHVYIVNLPDRSDRRAEMEQQLSAIKLEADENIEFFPAIRPDSAAGFPSLGARGCFMSHLSVLKDAARRGFHRVLILEDDLNFCRDFDQRATLCLNEAKKHDWSIFYGGGAVDISACGVLQAGLLRVNAELPVLTTHFIALQGQAIQETAAYLEAILGRSPGHPDGGPMHVDGAYSWYRRSNPARLTIFSHPELGYQRSSRTDIHNLRWYDRLPIIRDACSLVRRASNVLR